MVYGNTAENQQFVLGVVFAINSSDGKWRQTSAQPEASGSVGGHPHLSADRL